MSDPIEGLEALSLHIRDIHQARRFYGEVLGLKEVRFDEKGSRAAFAIPGTDVLLTMHVRGAEEAGRDPGTVTGIIFTSQDPVGACAEIRKRGGTVTDEPRVVQRPGITMVVGAFADPDGNEFLIRSPPTFTA